MAVKRLAKENRATVLCFYGPPGTGKTSLATSIATAMGRKLVKASLGGVDDESKLRGFYELTLVRNLALLFPQCVKQERLIQFSSLTKSIN